MLDLGGGAPTAGKPGAQLASTEQPSRLPDILAGLLVVVVGLATLLVFFLARAESGELGRLDSTYQQLSGELETGQAAQVTKHVQQLAATVRLLQGDSHPAVWSFFLKEVQRTTTPGVALQTLTVDERSILKIEGRADSYQTVAWYLATLRASPYAQRVELISTSLSSETDGPAVSFGFGVTLATDQLRGQPTAASGSAR